MTEEEARQIVGEHTTDELRVIAAALSIRQAENSSFRGSEMDADWNDRVGFYCLSLILMRGDQTIPDAKVPGYLRFQVRAAQQAGLGDIADALDKSPLPMSKGTTAWLQHLDQRDRAGNGLRDVSLTHALYFKQRASGARSRGRHRDLRA